MALPVTSLCFHSRRGLALGAPMGVVHSHHAVALMVRHWETWNHSPKSDLAVMSNLHFKNVGKKLQAGLNIHVGNLSEGKPI